MEIPHLSIQNADFEIENCDGSFRENSYSNCKVKGQHNIMKY